jgi:cysteinyl-tRNA synthetase
MPEMRLHNFLTKRREALVPLDPGHVRVYCCGPTVYDLAHIGNARPAVIYDVLVRLLRRLFDKVTYVRNVTDIDDKINNRAREAGVPISEITEQTLKDYRQDIAALGNFPPDHEPRATETIAEIIAIIERLITSGHAYEADGHVLFAVPSFPDYGKFSGRSPDELLAGARVDVAPYKRDAGDFVLWKPGLAGTSNAPPCPGSISAKASTSTAAAPTSSSRTMRTRSPSPSAPSPAAASPACGSITACSSSTARR